MVITDKARIRELSPEDGQGISHLVERVGFDTNTEENTKHEISDTVDALRPENPALAYSKGKLPRGWVIEAHGTIVGHLGNLPVRYKFKGREILGAAASGLIVQPEFRSMSIGLVAKFANQSNAELLLNTTAAPAPSKIFKALRFNQVVSPEYNRALYWVCDTYGFAGIVAARLGLSKTLSAVARPALAGAIVARRAKLSRRAEKTINGLSVDETYTIAESRMKLDILWETIQKSSLRLLADRSADSITWHFGSGGKTGRVRFLCCMRGGQLVGYVILAKFPVPALGMRRMRIVDLIALDEEVEIIDALLVGAYNIARKDKAHILELIGFPAKIRERAKAKRPLTRRLPNWTYLYKTNDAKLIDTLAMPGAWYACPYDGDASIM